MVRVYGAVFGDVTDRATRQLGLVSTADGPMTDLGVIYGWRERDYYPQALQFSRPLGVLDTPMPWWSHHPWGRVLMLDDFEGTLKWAALGGTISKASDATFVHDGDSAMKMATGATAGDHQSAIHIAGPAKEDSDFLVMEFWWCLSAAAEATPRDFSVEWWVHDRWLNTGRHFGFRYANHSGGAYDRNLMIIDAAGGWATIAGGGIRPVITSPSWNYWCLALERTMLGGYKYRSFQMNDVIMLLAGTPGETLAIDIPSQPIWITCTTDAAAVTTAYVDDFVLMDEVQFEP